MNKHREPTESELAALADGSLPAERRERLLALVGDSPELLAALEVQRRAIELTRSIDLTAPAHLHERIGRLNSQLGRRRAPSRPFALGGALAATAAAAAAVIILALGTGGTRAPTVAQISALTLAPATAPAPMQNRTNASQLTASVQGVAFPYWEERLGWRSTGTRVDRVGGRSVTTVFYENSSHARIGYAILAGAAPSTAGGSVTWRGGVPFRSISSGEVSTVTWRRAGHLCVISGRGVSDATLLRLASWKDRATA